MSNYPQEDTGDNDPGTKTQINGILPPCVPFVIPIDGHNEKMNQCEDEGQRNEVSDESWTFAFVFLSWCVLTLKNFILTHDDADDADCMSIQLP